MFYKKESDYWVSGVKITFPNGVILDENNKQEINGWFWSDEEPEEYTEWKKSIQNWLNSDQFITRIDNYENN